MNTERSGPFVTHLHTTPTHSDSDPPSKTFHGDLLVTVLLTVFTRTVLSPSTTRISSWVNLEIRSQRECRRGGRQG